MIFIYNKNLYTTPFRYENTTVKEQTTNQYSITNSINFTAANNILIEFPYLQSDPILELEFPDFPEE